ncbi:OsmC family protein [Luteimonas abyssi]|uniref:OsmC family protein n=1 Tax=Luteimonas abyssi TaxID=1247514 RepID=UPI0009EC989A|nr:OsmC family protein [Luteimonas abyssi]
MTDDATPRSAALTLGRATAHLGDENYAVAMNIGGHTVVADEPAALGGRNTGPRPFGLLLGVLGACTLMTLRMYAERKQWPLVALDVSLRYLRPAEGGADRIERVLVIGGLDDAQRAKLADIAERTPVTLAIKGGVSIDTRLTTGETT